MLVYLSEKKQKESVYLIRNYVEWKVKMSF